MTTDMKKAWLFLLIITSVCYMTACGNKKEKKVSPLGITSSAEYTDGYDLPQIQEAGELIAITLSGPDTYYEYKGKGVGLQFELAEHFANSIGTKLRMETARDTAELMRKLQNSEADLIALELPEHYTASPDLLFAGCKSDVKDSTGTAKRQWMVRKSSPLLAQALDDWYRPDIRTGLQNRDRRRFTPGGGVRRRMRAPMQNRAKGIISPYDADFIRHSRAIGWDWRLMAAQCYQESGFDPGAVSWTGARGLMQIMPETADHLGLPHHQIHLPGANIGAAARYLKELDRKFSDVPGRAERINFVLAAYNGGAGHVRDAMALARKHGKSPYRWSEVSPFILRLSQPQFYNDPVVKYGYLRGEETYGYVHSIQERWRQYRSSAPGGSGGTLPAPARRNSRGGFKSKVLSADELETKYKQE